MRSSEYAKKLRLINSECETNELKSENNKLKNFRV